MAELTLKITVDPRAGSAAVHAWIDAGFAIDAQSTGAVADDMRSYTGPGATGAIPPNSPALGGVPFNQPILEGGVSPTPPYTPPADAQPPTAAAPPPQFVSTNAPPPDPNAPAAARRPGRKSNATKAAEEAEKARVNAELTAGQPAQTGPGTVTNGQHPPQQVPPSPAVPPGAGIPPGVTLGGMAAAQIAQDTTPSNVHQLPTASAPAATPPQDTMPPPAAPQATAMPQTPPVNLPNLPNGGLPDEEWRKAVQQYQQAYPGKMNMVCRRPFWANNEPHESWYTAEGVPPHVRIRVLEEIDQIVAAGG